MSLAVARNPDHETWSWQDPEVGPHPALRGLGAFALMVGVGFGIAWAVSLAFDDASMQRLLLVASLGATVCAVVSLLASVLVRRRSESRAPSRVILREHDLRWAGHRSLPWTSVRSVGIDERMVERGRATQCVVVRAESGREVWLAVDQPIAALEELDDAVRDAWRRAHGAGHPPRLRLVEGGNIADGGDSP